jgi:RNA polymerase sigma-70 factor, ECF subfamily
MAHNLGQIYRQHGKYAYNVALRILANKSDAEDVMQNVFVKLNAGLSSFRGDSQITTYLYRMAVNESIDLIRRRKMMDAKHESMRPPDSHEASGAGPLVLQEALASLPEEQRAAVLLCEIAGFSYKEIAEILEVEIGTVKSRINRGINKLKEALK